MINDIATLVELYQKEKEKEIERRIKRIKIMYKIKNIIPGIILTFLIIVLITIILFFIFCLLGVRIQKTDLTNNTVENIIEFRSGLLKEN